MQNNQKIIAIFGAGGFIGKHLMRELTKLDYRIKVATRNPYLKGYLKPLGNPGQIELFKTNIFNSEDVKQVLENCAKDANVLKNLSSGPKTTDGLRITEGLNIFWILFSPSSLDCIYSEACLSLTPKALICTKFFIPTSLHKLLNRCGNWECI